MSKLQHPATPGDWPRAARFLDARGLDCPEPVLRARQALAALAPGELLLVRATDPHSGLDFEAFCVRTGNRLAGQREGDDDYWFLIEKAAAPRDTA